MWDPPEGDTSDLPSERKDDSFVAGYAASPLKPLKHFLHFATACGVFPAIFGDRNIHYTIDCESWKPYWCVLFTVIWLGWGIGLQAYCLLNTVTEEFSSIFAPKDKSPKYALSSTDQLVMVLVPASFMLFWFIFTIINWTRIRYFSEICHSFSQRGFRINGSPEYHTILDFLGMFFLFLVGQTIVTTHIGLVYCDSPTKKILYCVLVSIWIIPLYVAVVFCRTTFIQLCGSLIEYYRYFRKDVLEKSNLVKKRNIFYTEVIKRGLPRRFDRLYDNIGLLQGMYNGYLILEWLWFILYFVIYTYLVVSFFINGVQTKTVPWWTVGYALLVIHTALRMYNISRLGHRLNDEMQKVLTVLSQFAFVHSDTNLMCLLLMRKPTDSLLSVGGFLDLDRSLIAKCFALVVLGLLMVTNFKVDEYND